MTFELIKDTVKLTLIVAFLYLALSVYLGWRQPAWSAFARRRRFAILLALLVAVVGIKVSEDVVNHESGPFDVLALQFIHANVPPAFTGIFEKATISGSASVLAPLLTVVAITLLLAKRIFELLLLTASVISGGIIVYVLKVAVGRARPSLWDTEWYWWPSFPSGHTLVVAAFATATVIIVQRIWPRSRNFAVLIALVWVSFVGISRLVLGVHWPTDVLASICIGTFVPLAIGIALEAWHA